MKFIVSAIIGIVIVFNSGFSQTTAGGVARQISMGGMQINDNMVINPYVYYDPVNIFINPAYQNYYKNYGWFNIGGGRVYSNSSLDSGYGKQNAGIVLGFDSVWTFGTLLSYDATNINDLYSSINQISQRNLNIPPSVSNIWELMSSYCKDKYTFGFAVSYGWSLRERTRNSKYSSSNFISSNDYSTKSSLNMVGIRIGALFSFYDSSNLDLSGALNFLNASDFANSDPYQQNYYGEYSASGYEYQFRCRGRIHLTHQTSIVPFGMMTYFKEEPKEDVNPAKNDYQKESYSYNAHSYFLGIGLEYNTNIFLLAGGISWIWSDERGEYSFLYKQVNIPQNTRINSNFVNWTNSIPVINLGVEYQFTDWLKGRAGYYRSIGNYHAKSDSNYYSENSNPYSTIHYEIEVESELSNNSSNVFGIDNLVSLGLGFKFGGFSLDASINEEALRRGLGLIGSSDRINTFGYLTASYDFSE